MNSGCTEAMDLLGQIVLVANLTSTKATPSSPRSDMSIPIRFERICSKGRNLSISVVPPTLKPPESRDERQPKNIEASP